MLMVYHLRIVKNYCSAQLYSYGEMAKSANDHKKSVLVEVTKKLNEGPPKKW